MPTLKQIKHRSFRTDITSKGVSLCILQLQRDTQDVISDSPSASNVSAVRQLLQPGDQGVLAQHVHRDQAALLLCPEFAFASSDWADIDQLVRDYPNRLIVCAGFGLATSKAVDDIVRSAGVVAWDEPAPLPKGYRYNFGAIWIHSGHPRGAGDAPPQTHCYLFGKTVAEQSHEVRLNPYPFSEHIRVDLADLTVWPFICAEAINRQHEANTTMCSQMSHSTKPSLVLGLLRQLKNQDDIRWREALSALARARGDGQSTVSIANSAASRIASEDESPRNLSGIYASFGTSAVRAQNTPTIQSHNQGLETWLLRTAEPIIVLGTLHMGSHAADRSLHHFFPQHAWTVAADGALQAEHRSPIGLELSAAADVELIEFDADDARSIAARRVAEILQKDETSMPCRIDTIATSWLQGPLCPEENAPHSLAADKVKCLPELRHCIRAVGGLMNTPQDAARLELDFARPDRCDDSFNPAIGVLDDFPVWLWIDLDKDRRAMQTELARRMSERLCHPGTMLVLGRGNNGDFQSCRLNTDSSATQTAQPKFDSSVESRRDFPNATARSTLRKVQLNGIQHVGGLWKRNLKDANDLQYQCDELKEIHNSLKDA